MMVVTGANGFLGNNLVRQLLAHGQQVRCMVRSTSDLRSLAGLDVETVAGDLRDRDSLVTAFAGAKVVYNVAGVIAIAPGRERLMADVNWHGAANVAEACLTAGVERLCHVSSCHALKEPSHSSTFDEQEPFDPEMRMVYGRTKALGSLDVLSAARDKGLDAVIGCPTGIIGPNDYGPSEMGATFIDFARGRLAAVTPGGYNFVDVRDVASGLIALVQRGRTGEYYLLSGERVEITWLIEQLTGLLGQCSKPRKLGGALLFLIADLMALASRLTGSRPRVTRDSVETLMSNSNFTHAKASAEVGYTSRPLCETISDSVQWLQSTGVISELACGPVAGVAAGRCFSLLPR